MNATPEQVFDFIADISNLPKHLPTTKAAQGPGPGRVRVRGEANGHAYDGDGYLRPNRDALRLEWGADEGVTIPAGCKSSQPEAARRSRFTSAFKARLSGGAARTRRRPRKCRKGWTNRFSPSRTTSRVRAAKWSQAPRSNNVASNPPAEAGFCGWVSGAKMASVWGTT